MRRLPALRTALCWGVLALAVSGCVRPPGPPVPAAPLQPPAALPDVCRVPTARAGERILPIDASRSYLHIRAFRGGRLAHLGHNHIVSSGTLWGYVRLVLPLQKSAFALCIPVADLQVDDPRLRAAAGEEFASTLDATAIAGTRRNMLGDKLLDAERHPYVIVWGELLSDASGTVPLQLTISVRGARTILERQTRYVVRERELVANGQLTVRQSELGLEPYSALFGALLVRDELQIRYELVAREAG